MGCKILKWILIIVFITALVFLYTIYNPYSTAFFPKCPFRVLTGLKCPGCGSQRALHYLLNFDILAALHENFLLVLSIPYILTGFVFDLIKHLGEKFLKWRKFLFGQKAIFVVLGIIVSFWILRNLNIGIN